MVLHRASHDLNGLLGAVVGVGVVVLAAEGAAIRDLPDRGLLPAASPFGSLALANGVEAGFVLPMIVTSRYREMLLAPWLPAQGLTMLFSKRGVGKTHVALGIAHAVATGGRFLNWSAPAAHPVLYLDGEMPARTMQERIAAIVAGQGPDAPDVPEPDYFRLVTPDLQPDWLPDLASPEGQAALEPHLEGVKLLILDSLSTLCRSGVENEAESWGPVQEWALGLRRQGMSLLFVHHSGKGGLQRGTSRREDVLDTIICLKHPNDYAPSDGARFEVSYEKGRALTGEDAAPFEAKLEVRDGAAFWTTKDIEDRTTEQVVDLKEQNLTQRDIAIELGISKSTVNRHIKKARALGLIGQ